MKGSGVNAPPLCGISIINLKVSIPVSPVHSADTLKWEARSASWYHVVHFLTQESQNVLLWHNFPNLH